ncbi:hypothetical protein D3C78_951510 [compost metagenome]
MYQQVVRRNARLPCVHRFHLQNSAGCGLQIEIVGDDHRRLATQLQGYRRQVAGSRFHHLATCSCRTGEDQVIERQAGENRTADIRHNGQGPLIEVRAHQAVQQSAQIP